MRRLREKAREGVRDSRRSFNPAFSGPALPVYTSSFPHPLPTTTPTLHATIKCATSNVSTRTPATYRSNWHHRLARPLQGPRHYVIIVVRVHVAFTYLHSFRYSNGRRDRVDCIWCVRSWVATLYARLFKHPLYTLHSQWMLSVGFSRYQFYTTFTMWPPEVREDLRAGIKAKNQGDLDLSERYLRRCAGFISYSD